MRINCFVTPDSLQSNSVALSPEESHHLARVLRVKTEQEVTLFDGKGTRAKGIVETITKKEVTIRIDSRETVPPPAVEITLIQALCKPDRFELILQKATELGVRYIQPINTQNTALHAAKTQKLADRGDAIVRNAAQQCNTAWLPEIQPLRDFSEVISTVKTFDAAIIGSLHSGAQSLKKTLQSLQEVHTVALLIGPEGDFTKEEMATVIEADVIPVTFGNQILRTETAAIFGLSVLTYELKN
jgi:16S rRNA (uracil1498-N3)-methyltransferase